MLSPGDVFDRYVIEGPLGRGGMGSVYRARDRKLERLVALKVMSVEAGSEQTRADARARLLREGRAAAALDHPNAVVIHDVGEADGTPFIAMELVPGRTLRQLLGEPKLSWGRKMSWLVDVAKVLSAAHKAGLIHRDVKPENVMVRNDGVVKVLDFGIARRVTAPLGSVGADGAVVSTVTTDGVAVGTPIYMSPEQIRCEKLDARTDQFGWGVTAYEVLSGTLPWPIDNSLKMLAAILTNEPAAVHVAAPQVPPWIDPIIRRALSKNKDDRFPSMDDLIRAVGDAWVSRDDSIPPHSSPPFSVDATGSVLLSKSTKDPGRSRSGHAATRKVRIVAALSIGILAISGVVYGVRSVRGPTVAAMAMTDAPPPQSNHPEALNAYAAGLQALRDGNMRGSSELFEQAAKLDSSLAAANLRQLLLLDRDADQLGDFFQQVVQHRSRLSARDQVILDAIAPCMQKHPYDYDEAVRRLKVLAQKYPGDAEIWWTLGRFEGRASAFEDAIRSLDRAATLDPRFGGALYMKAYYQAIIGQFDKSFATIDACVASSPTASACMLLRMSLRRERGECAEIETEARHLLAIRPSDVRGLTHLALAQQALGRPMEAVRATLEHRFRQSDDRDRERARLNTDIALAIVEGDFEGALARMPDLRKSIVSERTRDPYTEAAATHVGLLVETGDLEGAGQVATQYLKEREGWPPSPHRHDNAIRADRVPLFLLAQRNAGIITHQVFERERAGWVEAWIPKTGREYRRLLWVYAWPASVETPEEAARALKELERAGGLPPMRFTYRGDGAIGNTYLLAGRKADAREHLERAVRVCSGIEDPFGMPQTWLALGAARAATGEAKGACEAYAKVVAQWGRARPRSVTAEAAAERAKKLGCP
jgi:eukaryotic-like serine/threonine-protein kinase